MRVILDFEASSLSDESYPIEVGWVSEDGREDGMLIRPAPQWRDWDREAEAMHGISRATLRTQGIHHEEVCDRLVGLFRDNAVYASAPSWDGRWLSMLLRAAGRPRHLIRLAGDTEELFAEAARQRLGPRAGEAEVTALVAAARGAAEAEPAAHRAVADARREWRIWQRIARG